MIPNRALRSGLCMLVVLLLLGAWRQDVASEDTSSGTDQCSRTLAQNSTPVAASTPDPASNRLAVSQAVMAFASCYNRHNWDGVLALTSEGFRETFIGASTPDDVRERLSSLDERGLLPELRIQSIEENGTTGSVLATLVITWSGWDGLHRELWRLQSFDGIWQITGRSIERPTVSGVAAGVEVIVDDIGLTMPRSDLIDPGTVILAFTNRTDDDRAALIVSVAPSSTPQTVVEDCNHSSGAPLEPVGAIQVGTGETVYLPLLDLPPGRYGIVVGIDPCLGDEQVTAAKAAVIDISS